jgi:hypothetical protein
MNNKEKIIYFSAGLLFGIMLVVTMGMTDISPPNYGRYQISSWAGQFGADSGGVGAFIVDTATGETRTVYSRHYSGSTAQVLKDNLRKPFHSIK